MGLRCFLLPPTSKPHVGSMKGSVHVWSASAVVVHKKWVRCDEVGTRFAGSGALDFRKSSQLPDASHVFFASGRIAFPAGSYTQRKNLVGTRTAMRAICGYVLDVRGHCARLMGSCFHGCWQGPVSRSGLLVSQIARQMPHCST